MDNRVFIKGCSSYNYDEIKTIIDSMFDAMGWNELISKGMKAAIKPNLIMKSNPDSAIITHPVLVAAVGSRLKELGADVIIAESSGGLYNSSVLKSTYNTCGYTKMADEYGLKLNYDCSYAAVEAPEGHRSRSFNIINPLLEADIIIDIAKLKTHCMTGLSGAVKNMFGSVPGLMKPELHCRFPEKPHFGEMLVDLCELMKPKICIVDAVLAMEGNGPTGGKPRKMGLIYGGGSAYNVDIVSTKLVCMKPSEVYMIQNAIDRGLCVNSTDKLELLGDPLEDFLIDDYLQPESKSNDFRTWVPKPFQGIAKKITTPKPKIRTGDCVGCGKCAESCPKHTITIKNRKAVIDYSKCIKCYCCHEMCPMKAIDIKRFSLFSL